MPQKVTLIADPNRALLKELGSALRSRGYDVRAARDGSKALEKTILTHPDLVLFDEKCPLIPAKKFVQILRSNPRTEHIPVIVMCEGEPDESISMSFREAFVRKPFNTDEVLSLVAATFRKMTTAQEVQEEGRKIQGSLSQIALVDLLQIFSLNRKTGLLEMKSDGQDGRIYVRDGNVVHASTGRHRSDKALFRLLQWRDGNFAFIPEELTSDLNIRRGTDVLLLEGAHQSDELLKLRSELPADSVRVAVVPELKASYEGLHPVNQEILNLLEFYHTVGELVEYARVSDYEACRAIRTMLDKGVLQAIEEEILEPQEAEPLLGHDMLFDLKVKLAAGGHLRSRITRATIGILSPDETFLKDFVAGARKLPGMELAGQLEATQRGFGKLGTLQLSENFWLDFMLLPIQSYLKPLWHPLGVGMVAALVLRSKQDELAQLRLALLAQELSEKARVPVVQLSPMDLWSDRVDGERTATDPANPTKVREVIVKLLHQIASELETPKTA